MYSTQNSNIIFEYWEYSEFNKNIVLKSDRKCKSITLFDLLIICRDFRIFTKIVKYFAQTEIFEGQRNVLEVK